MVTRIVGDAYGDDCDVLLPYKKSTLLATVDESILFFLRRFGIKEKLELPKRETHLRAPIGLLGRY